MSQSLLFLGSRLNGWFSASGVDHPLVWLANDFRRMYFTANFLSLICSGKNRIRSGQPTVMEATVDQPSSYELERGKPMPDTIHAAIQANLVVELKSRYRQAYRILSELTLDTPPNGSTPDVVIYPFFEVDFTIEYPAKRSDAPLVTIEIQSPSQSLDEMINKANSYFAFGVKSCWIVQPRIKGIFVFDRPNSYQFFHHDDVLKDPNLNIELSLAGIFE
ncbi:Uma2 family endonuclease [Larkinella sp. VNQ87]|uniref:Uma2 family endonuclease n=1 Tax=Larkinella sp. VNQ87 TaxID=3400921 RepID=UPI003C0A4E38